jgi:hypothetical protein
VGNFWCTKWHWDRFSSKNFVSPCQLPFHQHSIFIRGRNSWPFRGPSTTKVESHPTVSIKNKAQVYIWYHNTHCCPQSQQTACGEEHSEYVNTKMRHMPLLHAVDNWCARRSWPVIQKMHQTDGST